MDYSGTPLETEYDKIKRRREIMKAVQERSMAPHQNEMVSGHIVEYSPWEGLANLGSAFLAAKGQAGADKQQEALGEQYRQGVSGAVEKVTNALEGQNYSDAGPVQPTPDPRKAALMAASDPYLSSNKPVQDVINSMISAKSSQYPSYQAVSTPQGVKVFDRRTGQFMTPEEQLQFSQYDPAWQGLLSREKATGANISDLAYKPAIASGVEGAKAGVQLETAGEIEARKKAGGVVGETRGTAAVELPKVEEEYNKTSTLVDELINHPGFKDAVGFPDNPFTLGGLVPWTDAAGFKKRLDQLTGRGFMQVFPTLKGGGQITELEGQKAQESINRMSTATNEKEFLNAANDFKQELYRLKKVVADRAGVSPGQPPGGSSILDEADKILEGTN